MIPAKPLKPWLNRLIGMDWGFAHEGAAYWGCDNDDGRFHVYRELVRSRLGAEAWGVEIVLASMEDLKGQEQNTMTLYLSPDAWEKRSDTRTIADQIAAGIRRVLGPNSVLLTEEETGDPDEVERMRHQQRYGIMVRRAPNQRIAGAQYIRSQLRWWPLTKVAKESFSHDLFLRLLRADPSRAMEYKDAFETRQKQEVLPGLLIHDSCPRIIEVLQNVVHSLTNPEDVEKRDGDDPYDGFRYLVFAHSKEKRREPFEEHFARRLEQVAAMHGGVLDGNTRVQVARKAEEDYNQASEAMLRFLPAPPRAAPRKAGGTGYAIQHWSERTAPRKKSGLPPRVGGDKPHMAMIIAAIPKGGKPGGPPPLKRKPVVPPTRAPLTEPDEPPDMDDLPDTDDLPGGGEEREDHPILPEAVSYRSEQETCAHCVHMQDDGECARLHIPVSHGDGCNLFTDASGGDADESAERYEPEEAGEEEEENVPAYR